jgi:hypothetical protein
VTYIVACAVFSIYCCVMWPVEMLLISTSTTSVHKDARRWMADKKGRSGNVVL